MQKASAVLETKYRNDIEREIELLGENNKMLLGNIMAVIRRSDTLLGREKESHSGDAYYVIFETSIYSIVSSKDISLTSSEGSKYKLMSLNYYIEQLTEFNFTFMQLAYVGDEIFVSDSYKNIINAYKEMFEQNDLCNKLAVQKIVSAAIGITRQINDGKFRDKNILRDRLFLANTLIEIAMDNMGSNIFNIDSIESGYCITDTVSTYILIKDLGVRLGRCIEEQERYLKIIPGKSNGMLIHPVEYKKLKIINKTNLLKDLYKAVLNGEV